MSGFTHFNEDGNAVMVDVGEKAETKREALASGVIRMSEECTGRTGVEMEALTGVNTALLTIYDMCKAVDRGMEIREIHLLEKSGGKSGKWVR